MQPHIETSERPMTLLVSSPEFGANGSIPIEHTSDGADVPPEIEWSMVPEGTKSVAVIVDDPDAPNPEAPERTWVHWVVTGIHPEQTSVGGSANLPTGAVHGTNDFGKRAWNGSSPPIGRHRYFFKVYALDIDLDAPGISKLELVSAMKGHILAQGEIIGTYERPAERRSAAKAEERTTHGRH